MQDGSKTSARATTHRPPHRPQTRHGPELTPPEGSQVSPREDHLAVDREGRAVVRLCGRGEVVREVVRLASHRSLYPGIRGRLPDVVLRRCGRGRMSSSPQRGVEAPEWEGCRMAQLSRGGKGALSAGPISCREETRRLCHPVLCNTAPTKFIARNELRVRRATPNTCPI